MVAGGIAQNDIARARGISAVTLRKHYKQELAAGTTALNTIVLIEHIRRIKAGDFQAIKWWQQARMGWSERIVVDDGKPADTPMRVIVELVGEAAPSRVEQSAPRTGSRLSDTAARVQPPPCLARGQRRAPPIDRAEPKCHAVGQEAGAAIALQTEPHRLDRLGFTNRQAAVPGRKRRHQQPPGDQPWLCVHAIGRQRRMVAGREIHIEIGSHLHWRAAPGGVMMARYLFPRCDDC
jgi:hypothetical protein